MAIKTGNPFCKICQGTGKVLRFGGPPLTCECAAEKYATANPVRQDAEASARCGMFLRGIDGRLVNHYATLTSELEALADKVEKS